MRILYVTAFWTGLKDVLVEEKAEASGMPAFMIPLKHLISEGHSVDILIAADRSYPITAPKGYWMETCKIRTFKFEVKGRLSRFTSYILATWTVSRALLERRYDFIYMQGSLGAVANLPSLLLNVSSGQRLYGTFIAEKSSTQSIFKIFAQHPLEAFALTLPKAFLLITNDGTKGDLLHKNIGSPFYRFFFLLNGVNAPPQSPYNEKTEEHHVLFYPARLERWKRQDIAIEILYKLHKEHNLRFRLLCAGQIYDKSWHRELLSKAADLGIASYFEHHERLDKGEMLERYATSFATLSLYDLSNLGNVAIEALASGALLVARNDGSLDSFIESSANGILIDNPHDAASEIARLYRNPKEYMRIRYNAKTTAKRSFPSWRTRSKREIQMMKTAAGYPYRVL